MLPLQQRLHTLLRWRLEMQQPYIGTQREIMQQLCTSACMQWLAAACCVPLLANAHCCAMPKQKSSALVHAGAVAGGALPSLCEFAMFNC